LFVGFVDYVFYDVDSTGSSVVTKFIYVIDIESVGENIIVIDKVGSLSIGC
jgi:hypothetical protein